MWICIIESIIKRLRNPIIHFYIIVKFHIQIKFCASLSVSVSDSYQYTKCTIKYCTKKFCHTLHHYIPERPAFHITLLHTHTFTYTKTFIAPVCHLHHKYSRRGNVTFTVLHARLYTQQRKGEIIGPNGMFFLIKSVCNVSVVGYISVHVVL